MILIADGGSTKTDWKFINDGELIYSAQTGGVNPFHITEREIDKVLSEVKIPDEEGEITNIYFYGAGVTGAKAENTLAAALAKRFGLNVEICVGDDLLAAGKALFKDEKGIACILGTGSNSGLYIDGKIISKIPSLGYILGDEGSGTDIGKRFINALFKKAIPEDLSNEIIEKHNIEMQGVLENVYKSDLPARNLASYVKIIKEYIDHESVANIVEEAFNGFFRNNISRYKDYASYQIGFVGSIAFHYNKILLKVAREYGIEDVRIISSPIDELVNYHK